MPQMKPILWLYLFISFSVIIAIYNILNYFMNIYKNINFNKNMNNNNNMLKSNWKW